MEELLKMCDELRETVRLYEVEIDDLVNGIKKEIKQLNKNDDWELIKKICRYDDMERLEIFGFSDPTKIVINYSSNDCCNLIQAYEIKMADVISPKRGDRVVLISKVGHTHLEGMFYGEDKVFYYIIRDGRDVYEMRVKDKWLVVKKMED